MPGFFGVESYHWLKKMALQGLPCQAPGIIGSVLGLVDPVSVYCDWVRWKVGSTASISMWQHINCLSKSVPEMHYHVAGTLSNQQTTQRPSNYKCLFVVGCLLNVPASASVSQRPICLDKCACYHTETEVVDLTADPTYYLTKSQYTDTGLTSPSTDPITPGAWQGNH